MHLPVIATAGKNSLQRIIIQWSRGNVEYVHQFTICNTKLRYIVTCDWIHSPVPTLVDYYANFTNLLANNKLNKLQRIAAKTLQFHFYGYHFDRYHHHLSPVCWSTFSKSSLKCPLYVGPLFRNLVWNDSRFVSLTPGKTICCCFWLFHILIPYKSILYFRIIIGISMIPFHNICALRQYKPVVIVPNLLAPEVVMTTTSSANNDGKLKEELKTAVFQRKYPKRYFIFTALSFAL